MSTPCAASSAADVGKLGISYNTLIGNTPLIDLTHLASPKVPGVQVLGKAEFLNPGFSIKDRIARNILDTAEADGLLKPGMAVVAASSGNTGAATAMMCAMRGYKCIITTSNKCSSEKMNSIKAYGAELLVTPEGVGVDDPQHYMNVPKTLIAKNPDLYFDIDQYDNLKNPQGHYKTLGPEIWEQTKGSVTHFCAGGSTGGTISGVGKYLKEQNPAVKAVLLDPVGSIFKEAYESPTRKHGPPKKFLLEGVGKDTVPGAMNMDLLDEVIEITDQAGFRMCHLLAQKEGLLVGGSAGLNMQGAIELANRATEPAVIVTVLCDSGIKYLSKVYNPEYLEQHKIDVSNVLGDAPSPASPGER